MKLPESLYKGAALNVSHGSSQLNDADIWHPVPAVHRHVRDPLDPVLDGISDVRHDLMWGNNSSTRRSGGNNNNGQQQQRQQFQQVEQQQCGSLQDSGWRACQGPQETESQPSSTVLHPSKHARWSLSFLMIITH